MKNFYFKATFILIFSVTALDATAQLSGSYTIDTTASGPSNYKTFTAALYDLKLHGVSGPVIFNAASDIYYEQLDLTAISGASATNTITFQSASHDSSAVTLQYNTSSTANFVIRLNATRFITIRNMTIKANGSAAASCIDITNGSKHNRILHNQVFSKAGSNTINNVITSGNYTSDDSNTIRNNLLKYGYSGIRMTGATSTLEYGTIIDSNIITGFYGYGIIFFNEAAVVIKHNFISTINTATSTIYGMTMSTLQYGSRIEKNVIQIGGYGKSSILYGMNISGSQSKMSNPNVVANNFITLSGGEASFYGIYTSTCDTISFLYNSVLISSVASSTASYCFYMNSGNKVNLFNNNLANKSGGRVISAPAGSALKSDFNNLYVTGSYFALLGSAVFTNLAGWISVSLKDSNSVSVDPGYYANNDLHSYSSGISNKAKTNSLVSDDIDGQARSSNHPDIGADEFQQLKIDAGISRVSIPVPVCPATRGKVNLVLSNAGLDTIFNDSIYWSVNGALQTPYYSADTIIPGNSKEISPGTFTFLDGTVYEIKCWSVKPNHHIDSIRYNDTFILKGFKSALNGTYYIGPYKDYLSFKSAVNDLISYGVCGHVIFVADTGLYSEQLTIPAIPGASPTSTITFQSATNDSSAVRIKYSSTASTDNWVIKFDGASYITFKKITIMNNGSYYGRSFEFDHSCSHNSILNCHLKVVTPGNGNINNINFESYTHNYNHIENNFIENGNYGIRLYGLSTSVHDSGNIIRNNKFTGFSYRAVDLYFQENVIVDNNQMSNNTNSSLINAIRLIYCNSGYSVSGNKINLRNYGSTYGISLSYLKANSYSNGIVVNNSIVLSSSTTNNNTVQGITSTYCNYQNIYYNSIRLSAGTKTGTNPSCAVFLYTPDTASSTGHVRLENNILANYNGGYSVIIYQQNYLYKSDFNDLYSSDTLLAKAGTVSYNSLASWRNAIHKDSNSVSRVPSFKDTADLHLTNSSHLRLFHPIAIVPFDIEGFPRNTVNPNIGAYERLIEGFDILNEGFLLTADSICEGNYPLLMKIYNNSPAVLDSADVQWTVNSAPQAPYHLTSSIPAHKDTIILLGIYYFTGGSSYYIKTWTEAVNGHIDQDHFNDSMNYTVFVKSKPIVDLGKDTILQSGSATITLDAGNGMDYYYWYNGSTSQTLTIDSSGIGYDTLFAWVITGRNGCYAADTIMIIFQPGSSITEKHEIQILLYPNPTNGLVTLEIGLALKNDIDISICDIMGKTLKTLHETNVDQPTVQLDLSKYSAGIYLVKINSGSDFSVTKIRKN